MFYDAIILFCHILNANFDFPEGKKLSYILPQKSVIKTDIKNMHVSWAWFPLKFGFLESHFTMKNPTQNDLCRIDMMEIHRDDEQMNC